MNLEQLADLLHTIFCTRRHEEDMLKLKMRDDASEDCLWYLEGCLDNVWERHSHSEWLETARMFASVVEKNAPGELIQYVRTLTELVKCYEELKLVGLGELINLLFIKNATS